MYAFAIACPACWAHKDLALLPSWQEGSIHRHGFSRSNCVEKEPERCRGPGAPLLEFPWEEFMAPYSLSADLIYKTRTQLSRNVCLCVVKPNSASPVSTQTNLLKWGRSPSFPSMKWLETTGQCLELKSYRGHWPCVAMGHGYNYPHVLIVFVQWLNHSDQKPEQNHLNHTYFSGDDIIRQLRCFAWNKLSLQVKQT